MHRKMPALQKEMQASSTSNFRYFTCLLDKGHIKGGMGGTYVKTIGKTGSGKLMISNRQAGTREITFEIE